MATILLDIPDALQQKFEQYSRVWQRPIAEVIEHILTHATLAQFPLMWLEGADLEQFTAQLARDREDMPLQFVEICEESAAGLRDDGEPR